MNKVFVYGTLMSGCENHRLIQGSERIGAGACEGLEMYCDWIPYAVPKDGSSIIGEVYNVPNRVLAELDRLEGHPRFYKRKKMLVKIDGEVTPCWVYVYNNQPRGELVPNGDYVTFINK